MSNAQNLSIHQSWFRRGLPELKRTNSRDSFVNGRAWVQVVPCLALHDTMRHIGSSVATVGFGGCMGMSGFMLAVGAKVSTCCLLPLL